MRVCNASTLVACWRYDPALNFAFGVVAEMDNKQLCFPPIACAWITALVLVALPTAGTAQVAACGEFTSDHFGPFDYRTISQSNLALVERNHFNSDVEQLIKGQTSTIGGDLSYTLRSIPNHPRALTAMAKLARKEKRSTPAGSLFSVDCWFDRAIRFAPDDPTVRLVYGIELIKDGKNGEAIEQFKIALEKSPDNANVHYNLGLAYLSLKNYDESLAHARRAYELGFPLPGLRDKLVRAGVWKN